MPEPEVLSHPAFDRDAYVIHYLRLAQGSKEYVDGMLELFWREFNEALIHTSTPPGGFSDAALSRLAQRVANSPRMFHQLLTLQDTIMRAEGYQGAEAMYAVGQQR